MFITWALARQPALLDLCLERSLRAMAFAFGDATPFVTADLLALGDDDVGSGCERIARLIEPLDLPDGRDPAASGWSAASRRSCPRFATWPARSRSWWPPVASAMAVASPPA